MAKPAFSRHSLITALGLVLLFLRAASFAALTPEQESFRQKAVESLFNLDFVQSRAHMRALINTDPQNPFGYLFEAGILWWQASSEFGLFKDTPTLEGLFESDAGTAIELSKRLIESPDLRQRADGYFVSGMALGVRGQWYLYRRHYLKAYHDGKKAVKYLKKCVTLDPEYYDAYLGLGIFDYQTARLPVVLKLGSFFLAHGNTQRGKERIREAAHMGRLVPRQASAFLLSLLILDEKDYASAMRVLRELRSAFPSSPYYRFIEVLLLYKLKDFDGSYRTATALFGRSFQDPEILQRKQLSIFCGLAGSKCFDEDTLEMTIDWLNRALPAAQGTALTHPALAAWPTLLHLYRGIVCDLLDHHSLALQDYRKVLEGPDIARAHERAKHCSNTLCDESMVLKMLKEMSLADDQMPLAPAATGAPPSRSSEMVPRDPD